MTHKSDGKGEKAEEANKKDFNVRRRARDLPPLNPIYIPESDPRGITIENTNPS